MLTILVIVLLVVLLFGALPHWGYAANYNYGYWPSGVVGLIVIILLVLLLAGHL